MVTEILVPADLKSDVVLSVGRWFKRIGEPVSRDEPIGRDRHRQRNPRDSRVGHRHIVQRSGERRRARRPQHPAWNDHRRLKRRDLAASASPDVLPNLPARNRRTPTAACPIDIERETWTCCTDYSRQSPCSRSSSPFRSDTSLEN